MLRLFLAVDLPDPVRLEVATLCTQVKHARWVKPHQLHITLRFMGQTPEQALANIRDQLGRVQAPAFDLALRGTGIFPGGASSKRARVLWLGLEPVEPLTHLKQAIDECLGPDLERTSFSPHLTLARFIEKPDPTLTQFLAQHHVYRSAYWPVACFHLYKSTLSSSGAVHEVLRTYSLAPI
jgi:RNA 2',3'-cyclic 3'-phosphodiesterase